MLRPYSYSLLSPADHIEHQAADYQAPVVDQAVEQGDEEGQLVVLQEEAKRQSDRPFHQARASGRGRYGGYERAEERNENHRRQRDRLGAPNRAGHEEEPTAFQEPDEHGISKQDGQAAPGERLEDAVLKAREHLP